MHAKSLLILLIALLVALGGTAFAAGDDDEAAAPEASPVSPVDRPPPQEDEENDDRGPGRRGRRPRLPRPRRSGRHRLGDRGTGRRPPLRRRGVEPGDAEGAGLASGGRSDEESDRVVRRHRRGEQLVQRPGNGGARERRQREPPGPWSVENPGAAQRQAPGTAAREAVRRPLRRRQCLSLACHRPHRGAEGRRGRDLRFGRRGRCRQLRHPRRVHRFRGLALARDHGRRRRLFGGRHLGRAS